MRQLLFACIFLMVGQFSNASNDLFFLDYPSEAAQFNDLNTLEAYLQVNEGVTYMDLLATESSLISNITNSSHLLGAINEPPLGIPSFVWGCILGWVGILIVYFVSEDKDETKKALYGCLVSTVGAIVVYVIWVVFAAGYYLY